jgi:hypothetical protein
MLTESIAQDVGLVTVDRLYECEQVLWIWAMNVTMIPLVDYHSKLHLSREGLQ